MTGSPLNVRLRDVGEGIVLLCPFSSWLWCFLLFHRMSVREHESRHDGKLSTCMLWLKICTEDGWEIDGHLRIIICLFIVGGSGVAGGLELFVELTMHHFTEQFLLYQSKNPLRVKD